jgi:4-amino-4-deoxy-L-arabinose transferase-like glycosyltransferase
MKTLQSTIQSFIIGTLTVVFLSLITSSVLLAQNLDSANSTQKNQHELVNFTSYSFTIPLFSTEMKPVSMMREANINTPNQLNNIQLLQEEKERKRKRLWWIVGGATTVVVTSAILISSSGGDSGDYIPKPPGRP